MPQWNRNTKKVELLPPVDGIETTRQTSQDGMVMVVSTTESKPPEHLVRKLGDSDAPFVGSWTYDITPTQSGGSLVELSESSIVAKPIVRVLLRLMGPTRYMDEHLQDLARKFGETAGIQ